MVCDVVEVAAGVGVVWARRDGVGAAEVVVGVAMVLGASALSVLAALASVDVAVLSSGAPAVTFVLVPSSALSLSLALASARACCPAAA